MTEHEPTAVYLGVTSADVERIARRDFAGAYAEALAVLGAYGAEGCEQEPARVRLAALRAAAGDLAELRLMVRAAKQDFRDVLAWAECPSAAGGGFALLESDPEGYQRRLEEDARGYERWLRSPLPLGR